VLLRREEQKKRLDLGEEEKEKKIGIFNLSLRVF